MRPSVLVEAFVDAAKQVRAAVDALDAADRRARTDRAGQYRLDVVADVAALGVLDGLGCAILSEESAYGGTRDAGVTIVLDPVDGSTNASRRISYWATSICAVDREGPLAACVVNQATGEVHRAVRGEGAFRDDERLRAATTDTLSRAVVACSGRPPDGLVWRQYRVLGCAALTLCDVATGGIDASVDMGPWHAPWDYLGGLLMCREAGAVVDDATGAELVTLDFDARRQVIAAATPALRAEIRRRAGL